MSRVKRGTTTHKRHTALLERAKGYRTGRRSLFKRAKEAVLKAGQFAYRDRRTKKRTARSAWIVQINAAVREHNLSYSQFMHVAKQQGMQINRKLLADLAQHEPAALKKLISSVTKSK
jgi:large subunit ribosomal protein L20